MTTIRVVGKTVTGVGAVQVANTMAVSPAISIRTVRSPKGLVAHGAKHHLLKAWILKIDAEIGMLGIAVGLVDKIRNLVDSEQRDTQRDLNHDSNLRHDQVL